MLYVIKCVTSIGIILCNSSLLCAMDGVEYNSSPEKSITSIDSRNDCEVLGVTIVSPDCTENKKSINSNILQDFTCRINGTKISAKCFSNFALEDMKETLDQLNKIKETLTISWHMKTNVRDKMKTNFKFSLLLRHGHTFENDEIYKKKNAMISWGSKNARKMYNWKTIFNNPTIITSELFRAQDTGKILNSTYIDERLNELKMPSNYKDMSVSDMLEDSNVQRMCADHNYQLTDGESVKSKADDLANCIINTLKDSETSSPVSHCFVSHCIAIGSFVSEYVDKDADLPKKNNVFIPPVTDNLDGVLIGYDVEKKVLSIIKYPVKSNENIQGLCNTFVERKVNQMYDNK